jgi:cell wall-associated NlpC family hydrolase
VAAGAIAALFGGLLALVLVLATLSSTSSPSPSVLGTALNTAAVPQRYVSWVIAAGSLCTAIPAAVIAAQDQAESGWNPDAVSPAGAEGIAQFLPSTFKTWGRNDDGTGYVSPFNPYDEIMAQGRYDCSLASLTQQLIGNGKASGSATDLALAAYNAGPGSVEAAHGIPADAAAYVQQIDQLAATKYSDGTAASSEAGLVALAAAESALGTPYQYRGSCDDPHGADSAEWCDCSSLVQMAWRTAGVELSRTTYQQAGSGTPVASVADLQPGDLIFIPGSDGTPSNPGHVGMFVGDGLLINAPETGEVVQFATVASWQGQIVAMRHIG